MRSEKKWKEVFSQRLNECIKCGDTGLTIPQIAKHLGVSRYTIYRWINAESVPSAYMIYKLSLMFHVSPAYFIAVV